VNQRKPILHGFDHVAGGADPIPGAAGREPGEWLTLALVNGWANVDPACPFQYRWAAHLPGESLDDVGLEFQGAITGGPNGSTVGTFPLADRFDCDKDDVPVGGKVDGESRLGVARIDAATGELIVTFPISVGGSAGALPTGGTRGQVLAKTSSTDYATAWSDPTYTHTQGSASATWTITHNLNRFPAVTVVDSGNSEIIPNVVYTNANTLVVSFDSPTSGKAYLN